MTYEIHSRLDGQIISNHPTQSDAVSVAEKMTPGSVCVIAHETSGTYRSSTQVWPERGKTYTA